VRKVLVTGMTSPQASSKINEKTTYFSGVLVEILESAGYDVEHSVPSVRWDKDYFDMFDVVLVGVSPVTSVTSNYVYGGLSVIEQLKDSSKLKMFIDAPEPHQIFSSLRSVIAHEGSIVKSFYSFRREYHEARSEEVTARLMSAVDYLINDNWKTCIYPSLPWASHYKVCAQVDENAAKALSPLNVDAYLLNDTDRAVVEKSIVKKPVWLASDISSGWTKRTMANSKLPFIPVKESGRTSDLVVKERLLNHLGAAVSPHGRNGTWWTPLFVYAMNTVTPIVTDWRESSSLGESWNYIAPAVEDLDVFDRIDLSFSQREQYVDKIADRSTVLHDIETYLQLR
jgi:hypothetical protein